MFNLNNKSYGEFKFNVYSMRVYGNPKLKKPKELRGIKPMFSVDYIPGKCKCQVFINGNDVWLKHRDYLSESLRDTDSIGAPLDVMVEKHTDKTKSKKFVYGDAWGDIVLRNEAWLMLENVVGKIKDEFELDVLRLIVNSQEDCHDMNRYDLMCTDMERMWEKVISGVKEECL